MKIALITDLHFGCRSDLPIFYDYFGKFYIEFINYLKTKNISTVFILGDVFDKRKGINFKTLDVAEKCLFNILEKEHMNVHCLIGNHDIHYRESLQLSSPMLVLSKYKNIKIYDMPQVLNLDDTTISMIPWMCKENRDSINKFMSETNTDLCFGHFDIKSFQMYKGSISKNGMEKNVFEKYELVCSGHFHTKSSDSNITYIGSPYEMNWQDCDDSRGFHIFDLDTRKLEFVQNTEKLFYKITYNDGCDFDISILKDKFVKVIVSSKKDSYLFEQFIDNLTKIGCYEIKIIEDIVDVSSEVDNEVNITNTMDVVSNYINNMEVEDNMKDVVNVYMKELYLEAINDSI